MKIKIQNFLFLLFCACIGKFLYTTFLLIIILLVLSNHWLIFDTYLPYLQIPAKCFYPLALFIGGINLCYTRLATYIYQTSCLRFPRLQWYSLFLGSSLIVKEFITEFQLIILLLISCITAALCHKEYSWQQRFIPSTIFLVMLISFVSGYFFNSYINN